MVKFLAAHPANLRDMSECHGIVCEALEKKNAMRIFTDVEA